MNKESKTLAQETTLMHRRLNRGFQIATGGMLSVSVVAGGLAIKGMNELSHINQAAPDALARQQDAQALIGLGFNIFGAQMEVCAASAVILLALMPAYLKIPGGS